MYCFTLPLKIQYFVDNQHANKFYKTITLTLEFDSKIYVI